MDTPISITVRAIGAPIFGNPLLALVSPLPRGDWRVGLPLIFCAALQDAALLRAVVQFGHPQWAARPVDDSAETIV